MDPFHTKGEFELNVQKQCTHGLGRDLEMTVIIEKTRNSQEQS